MTSEGRWGKLKYTKEHTVCNTQTHSNGLKADRLHCNGSWKKSREKTRSVCFFLNQAPPSPAQRLSLKEAALSSNSHLKESASASWLLSWV